jgi:hypothetical protein
LDQVAATADALDAAVRADQESAVYTYMESFQKFVGRHLGRRDRRTAPAAELAGSDH